VGRRLLILPYFKKKQVTVVRTIVKLIVQSNLQYIVQYIFQVIFLEGLRPS